MTTDEINKTLDTVPILDKFYHQHPRISASPPASTTLPAASRNLKAHNSRSVAPPSHRSESSTPIAASESMGELPAESNNCSPPSTSTIYKCENVFAPRTGRRSNLQMDRSSADKRLARPPPLVPLPACKRVFMKPGDGSQVSGVRIRRSPLFCELGYDHGLKEVRSEGSCQSADLAMT